MPPHPVSLPAKTLKDVETNTYSIVARCEQTGELGCAIASAVPAVAAICVYIRTGIGAVSTQSWANPYLAGAILDWQASGAEANDAIIKALATDEAASFRQVGAIGLKGPGASWSGADCTPYFGELTGSHYAIQGNMLTGAGVLTAMEAAFIAAPGRYPLAERLMRVLEAGQAVGGDKRGKQSAGLKVVGCEDYARVDLRVDEHAAPVRELRRVMTIASAQLTPCIEVMPRRNQLAQPAPEAVVDMLLKSPPDRPGGGGDRTPAEESEVIEDTSQ